MRGIILITPVMRMIRTMMIMTTTIAKRVRMIYDNYKDDCADHSDPYFMRMSEVAWYSKQCTEECSDLPACCAGPETGPESHDRCDQPGE